MILSKKWKKKYSELHALKDIVFKEVKEARKKGLRMIKRDVSNPLRFKLTYVFRIRV